LVDFKGRNNYSNGRAIIMNAVNCLVSGFDPFDNDQYNPSQEVVESLPSEISLKNGTLLVRPVILPTCCEGGWQALQKAYNEAGEPALVLLTGYAARAHRIRLERFALNIREYRIADNAGHKPMEEYIDRHGPEAVRTTIPIAELSKHLQELGYYAQVSNHAGSYVCNETYYRALRVLQGKSNKDTAVLFVHFPLPELYADEADDGQGTEPDLALRKENVQILSKALQEILRFSGEYLFDQVVVGDEKKRGQQALSG
jgi:pyroglutamyl-peptidase